MDATAPADRWRSMEAWSKRLLWHFALCLVVGVGVAITGLALIASGRDPLGVLLVNWPGALFLGGLPSDVIDRLPDAALFPLGLACAVFVWAIVALGIWHVTAFAMRLVFRRSAR